MLPTSETDRICILALMHTPGIGSVTIRQLISYCGGASQVFLADYKKLIKIPGIGDKVVRAVLSKNGLDLGENEFRKCSDADVQLHFFTDHTYPARLNRSMTRQ